MGFLFFTGSRFFDLFLDLLQLLGESFANHYGVIEAQIDLQPGNLLLRQLPISLAHEVEVGVGGPESIGRIGPQPFDARRQIG